MVSWWFGCNLHHRHGASLFSRNYFISPDSINISGFAPGSLLQSCTSINCVLSAFKNSWLIERVLCWVLLQRDKLFYNNIMGSNFSFLCIWAFECLPLLNQSAETYPFSSDLESITASLMTLSFPVSLSVSPSSSSACTHLVPAGPLGIRQPRMRQGHLGQGWMAYRPSPPKDSGKHNPTSRSFCL